MTKRNRKSIDVRVYIKKKCCSSFMSSCKFELFYQLVYTSTHLFKDLQNNT